MHGEFSWIWTDPVCVCVCEGGGGGAREYAVFSHYLTDFLSIFSLLRSNGIVVKVLVNSEG